MSHLIIKILARENPTAAIILNHKSKIVRFVARLRRIYTIEAGFSRKKLVSRESYLVWIPAPAFAGVTILRRNDRNIAGKSIKNDGIYEQKGGNCKFFFILLSLST